jgi:hypothetical protein
MLKVGALSLWLMGGMLCAGILFSTAWAQDRPRSLEAVTQELALAKGDYDACRRNLGDVLAQYTTQAEELRKLKTSPEAKTPGTPESIGPGKETPASMSNPTIAPPKEGQP